MEDGYDAIVLGTGLKECIISGLLSVAGKKVCNFGGRVTTLDL
jgi:Rab GDP dissociation inhibitor